MTLGAVAGCVVIITSQCRITKTHDSSLGKYRRAIKRETMFDGLHSLCSDWCGDWYEGHLAFICHTEY